MGGQTFVQPDFAEMLDASKTVRVGWLMPRLIGQSPINLVFENGGERWAMHTVQQPVLRFGQGDLVRIDTAIRD